jgi:hypothetical protein
VFYRFLYRIGLWWLFVWKSSRLDLQLDAAHPDGAGGLGFMGLTLRTFKEAAFAISTSLAGGLATMILLTNTRVSDYKYEIAASIFISTFVFCGPLLFFNRLLAKAKQAGTLNYWVLWQTQQRQFERKWMRGSIEDAEMLSVADFSEATDLSSILERVQQTKLSRYGSANFSHWSWVLQCHSWQF